MAIKVFKFISVYLAGLLLILHGLVPHQHHDESSIEEHEVEFATADNVMDFLELIFHIDMGDGHLENFQNANTSDLDISKSNLSIPIIGLVSEYISLPSISNYQKTPIEYPIYHRVPIDPYDFSLTLRGPPFIS